MESFRIAEQGGSVNRTHTDRLRSAWCGETFRGCFGFGESGCGATKDKSFQGRIDLIRNSWARVAEHWAPRPSARCGEGRCSPCEKQRRLSSADNQTVHSFPDITLYGSESTRIACL